MSIMAEHRNVLVAARARTERAAAALDRPAPDATRTQALLNAERAASAEEAVTLGFLGSHPGAELEAEAG